MTQPSNRFFSFTHFAGVLGALFIAWGNTAGAASTAATPMSQFSVALRTQAAALSPDGKLLVIAGVGSTPWVWSVASGRPLFSLPGHTGQVYAVAFSPDGTSLVTASADRTAKTWNVRTGALLTTMTGHTDAVYSAMYSPDGTSILTASADNTARVWSADTGRARFVLSTQKPLYDSYFPRPHALYSADGLFIATLNVQEHQVHWWDAQTGSLLRTIQTTQRNCIMNTPSLSVNGRDLFFSCDDTISLLDIQSGKTSSSKSINGHMSFPFALFSPKGTFAVEFRNEVTMENTSNSVVFQAADTNMPLYTWELSENICSAGFSADETTFFAVSCTGIVYVRDLKTHGLLQTVTPPNGHTGDIVSLSYGPDGHHLLTSATDGTARLWDANTGELQYTLSTHGAEPMRAQFSRDGAFIFTAPPYVPSNLSPTTRIWDANTATLLQKFPHTSSFDPDPTGDTLWMLGEREQKPYLEGWDVEAKGILHSFVAPTASGFRSLGANTFLLETNSTLAVWNPVTHIQHTLVTQKEFCPSLTEIAPDAKALVTIQPRGEASVWDLETRKRRYRIKIPNEKIVFAQFAPTGNTMLVLTQQPDPHCPSLTSRGASLKILAPNGDLLYTLPTTDIKLAAYAHDGHSIATLHTGGMIRTWRLP